MPPRLDSSRLLGLHRRLYAGDRTCPSHYRSDVGTESESLGQNQERQRHRRW
jgi:hypothetical protein